MLAPTCATVRPSAPPNIYGESIEGAADETELAEISGTERAVYGSVTPHELQAFLDAWARLRLGSPIGRVRFRAGRIDVVWGVELEDGRAVVIKTHGPPVDLDAVRVANEAQRLLTEADFPCAAPLAGPDEIEGRVLTAETLIEGRTPGGRDPAGRLLLAGGLARHIESLTPRRSSQVSPQRATPPVQRVAAGCQLRKRWRCSCVTTTLSAPNRWTTGSSELPRALLPGSSRSMLAGRSASFTMAFATKPLCRWFESAERTICLLAGDVGRRCRVRRKAAAVERQVDVTALPSEQEVER